MSEAPVVYCRCCGQKMEAIYQRALVPGRESKWYLTCTNEGCAMEGQTLYERTYASADLSKYMPLKAVEG